MGRREDLHGEASAQRLDSRQQAREDGALPPRMQVQLGLVDQEHQLFRRGDSSGCTGRHVFRPGPDEEIGQAEHTLHGRGREGDRDDAVRGLQHRHVATVLEVYAARLGRRELPFFVGELAEHGLQHVERWCRPALPLHPVREQSADHRLSMAVVALLHAVPDMVLLEDFCGAGEGAVEPREGAVVAGVECDHSLPVAMLIAPIGAMVQPKWLLLVPKPEALPVDPTGVPAPPQEYTPAITGRHFPKRAWRKCSRSNALP